MNIIDNTRYIFFGSLILIFIGSCGVEAPENYSATTGWAMNWKNNGGFNAKLKNGSAKNGDRWTGTKIPNNMVFVQGGTFVMGRTQEDIMKDRNNIPKEVTVSSFWMDQTEITNLQYREYTFWMKRVFWEDGEGEFAYLYTHSLPDSTVWRSELSYNEPMVTQYYRHPAYQDYPVVGVSWQQANDYCDWRTDRVNERRLIESGVLSKTGLASSTNKAKRMSAKQIEKTWRKWKEGFYDEADIVGYFNTMKYLKYEEYNLDNWEKPDAEKKGLYDLGVREDDEPNWKKKRRKVQIEDGIFTSPYRLPTEAEWEYAAVAGYNTTVSVDGNSHGKFYPWRSLDADYHSSPQGGRSGRNSLRQPFDQGQTFTGVKLYRNQYGKLRNMDNDNNPHSVNTITDGAHGWESKGNFARGVKLKGDGTFSLKDEKKNNKNHMNSAAGSSFIYFDNYLTQTGQVKSYEYLRKGQFLANFRHGRGDYAGVSPFNNDLGTMTMPVGSFPPNDWGLYDMAGNVNEWVMDVYRPLTPMESADLNPFRGNIFKQVSRGDDGYIRMLEDLDDSQAKALGLMAENGEYIYPAQPGTMVYINEQLDGNDDPIDDNLGDRADTDRYNWNDQSPYNIYRGRDNGSNYVYENPASTHSDENYSNPDDKPYGRDAYDYLSPKSTNPRTSPKRQYNRSNNIDYRDGEGSASLGEGTYSGWGSYDYGRTTLINNYTRVYKGGSWQDDAYWLSPGNKRFLNEDLAQSDIGFRCVIDHLGYVSGGEYELNGQPMNGREGSKLWYWKRNFNDNKRLNR